jgi:hypothetical protein
LLQIGGRPIAAGVAAFSIGFIVHFWLANGPAPANGLGAPARIGSAFDSIEAKPLTVAVASLGSANQDDFSARWATSGTQDAAQVAFSERFAMAEAGSSGSTFSDRFTLDQGDAPTGSVLAASFEDRFGNELAPAANTKTRTAAAAVPMPRQRLASAESRPVARGSLAQAAPKRAPEAKYRLASASDSLPLSYAPTDIAKGSPVSDAALKDLAPNATKSIELDPRRTAVYDITSQTVYLPNGRRLEAHSGLGKHMDNPRSVHLRMNGPTPPNIYDLKMREAPFHGVRAIRLVPTDRSKMYGRDGILAHSYMLGPSGASNGCVSLKDYDAFLAAYERGEFDRLVVVERFANPPGPRTASDWLKDLFKS